MQEKFFNTAGPNKQYLNYTISSFERIDWDEIMSLINAERYFILHAPRQTGKTTALLEMMHRLNGEGKYHAVYANIETAQSARNDVDAGIMAACTSVVNAVRIYLNDQRLYDWYYDAGGNQKDAHSRLESMLVRWTEISDKPTVLFLDEVDALVGDTLISLLRQLRAGYNRRPSGFPQSIALCGLRDVKDYRIHRSDGEIITGGSAFNIKAKSLRMGNFNREEMEELLLQHTDATGQVFEEGIFDELWEDTKGQPWLVNAMAHEMVWEDKSARDRSVRISRERYFAARERLILSRATHLDQLADKLQEPRVHRVIADIVSSTGSDESVHSIPSDDIQYCEDMGLIARRPKLKIANRIYQEMIPRELNCVMQAYLTQELSWYQAADGRILMDRLIPGFQQFFRENSEVWLERFLYKEAGPQLLLQAFLQRLINGGGRIFREYGLGSLRTDLLIEWPLEADKGFYGKVQRIVIEVKLLRGSLEKTLEPACDQALAYTDKCGASETHILVFDRNKETPWDEKIWHRTETYGKREISLWGC